MEKDIVVPQGMVEAAYNSQMPADKPTFKWDEADELTRRFYRRIMGAALCWLRDNPIVPNHAQAVHLCETFEDNDGSRKPDYCDSIRQVAIEWQRQMFLPPEPNVPVIGAIDHPCDDLFIKLQNKCPDEGAVNRAIDEAYRRGMRGK